MTSNNPFMKFLYDNAKFSTIPIIAGAIILIAVFERWRTDKIIEEFSNNTTIIVEVTVGVVIAVIVYGIAKGWQKEMDTTLNETNNIAKSLAEMNLKGEIRMTQTNIKYLNNLREYNEELSMFHDDYELVEVSEPSPVKELKRLYKTCIQLWEMYDGPEDCIVSLTEAASKIKPKSMILNDDELLEDLHAVIEEQRDKISRCMEMEKNDLKELRKSTS